MKKLLLIFAVALASCNVEPYDYCDDVDVFVDNVFSHTEIY